VCIPANNKNVELTRRHSEQRDKGQHSRKEAEEHSLQRRFGWLQPIIAESKSE
jgi:hypothetical protein